MSKCRECGKSIDAGSGRFVNRVYNFDDDTYTCEECDRKLRDENPKEWQRGYFGYPSGMATNKKK